MTEITDTTISKARGVIFFDAACGACSAGATRFERILGRRGFVFVPLQLPEAVLLTHLSQNELRREMKLRIADGRVLGGVDALLYLARSVPLGRPLAWLGATRVFRPFLDSAYQRFARNRNRRGYVCRIDAPDRLRALPWILAIALIICACAIPPLVAPWVTMWTIAVAIFLGLKLLTWWPLRRHATLARSIGYFLGTATLDAKRFCLAKTTPRTDRTATLHAAICAVIGVALLWIVAPLIPLNHPQILAWTGMIGIVLMLHFGLLQLLSIAWQARGVDCPLVMNKPLSFVSLADFWSRWNRPFTTLAFDTIFRPLRRFSIALATMATFVASGLIHDLAISVPAGAGFGWPTLYFVIQGAGILLERKLHLPAVARRLFAAVVLVAPASLLFHPPFVHNVVLPMMSAVHALGKELP